MLLTTSEETFVRNRESVEIWQVIPLVMAALLLTIGLAMFLSGTHNIGDVVRPVIVVFGGTLAAMLITFSTAQMSQALQTALLRGLRGGAMPLQMIKAMLKVCEISRRDGLLGVADVRSDATQVEEVCSLIGDASVEQDIRAALDRRLARERIFHSMTRDVFFHTAIYAVLMGMLGTLLLYVSHDINEPIGPVFLPLVCGLSLAIMMSILLGRLRAAHMRELIISEIAFQAATIILDDNNVQRLYARLAPLVPVGMK